MHKKFTDFYSMYIFAYIPIWYKIPGPYNYNRNYVRLCVRTFSFFYWSLLPRSFVEPK